MAILSPRALEGLKAYKYKPGGYTIMDTIHTPFWNWLTEQLPMWLAPNLITLSGLVVMFAAYLLCWWFLPEFTGNAPSWVYHFAGFSIILYTNLDCIDGKQARRTKTSSPLGQLFDHGCDAFSLHIMMALTQGAMNHRSDYLSSLIIMSVNMPWLVSHYEEYHTGILMYGDGYFGILEANYTLALIMIVTGLFGPALWLTPLANFLPVDKLPPSIAKHLPETLILKHAFLVIAFTIAIVQLFGQLYRVFKFHVDDMPKEERGHKELGNGARIKHLAYLGVLIVNGFFWLEDGGTHPCQSRLEALSYGMIYAYVATQLIMDHMCKEPFRPPMLIMIALCAGTLNFIFGFVPRQYAAYGFTPIMLVMYLGYVMGIVKEVCTFLGIKCLTIPDRSKQL